MVKQAAKLKVADIMYSPEKGEYIDCKATIADAIHQLIIGHHHSLLVMEQSKIVGVLRLTDMFKYVADMIVAGDA